MMVSTPLSSINFHKGSPVVQFGIPSEQLLLGYDMVPVVRNRRGDPEHGMWAGTVWGTITYETAAKTNRNLQ